MKRTILALVLGLSLIACNVFATTYHFEDNWVNWPGYTSSLGDTNGTPQISSMDVIVSESGILQQIDINLNGSGYQLYDSLFINSYNELGTGSNWDSWDYFVHDGGNSNVGNTSGTVATDGLYSVHANFDYTFVINSNRIGNPNGIDTGSLSLTDSSFGASHTNYLVSYDFAQFDIDISDGFFVAYAPWCDNDIIGGGTAPVPEPATMVLLGSGLVGLAFYRRKLKK